MLCACHLLITPDVEVVPMDCVNTAMERLLKSDVKYRFVLDIGNILKKSLHGRKSCSYGFVLNLYVLVFISYCFVYQMEGVKRINMILCYCGRHQLFLECMRHKIRIRNFLNFLCILVYEFL